MFFNVYTIFNFLLLRTSNVLINFFSLLQNVTRNVIVTKKDLILSMIVIRKMVNVNANKMCLDVNVTNVLLDFGTGHLVKN